MSTSANLTNQFLIAMPGLQDPNFFHTVTYICEHSEEGAMGIVVNRPMDLRISDILEQMDIAAGGGMRIDQQVYIGGPVAMDRGFVLHGGDRKWGSTLEITPQISITTSRDILEAIALGKGPVDALVALGYAGWGSGQLEDEIGANAWLSSPANPDIIFHVPAEDRWRAAARLVGVDLDQISSEVGHA